MTSQIPQLVMGTGPTPGKIFPLDKDVTNLGRDISNDVVINDVEISRRHARITRQAGGYMLEDLGSTNGTFVDGKRLTAPHLLQPNATITIGEKITLTYLPAPFDLDATVAGAPPTAVEPLSRAQPAPAVFVSTPQKTPAYTPSPTPAEPAYAGRIPFSPEEVSTPSEQPRRLDRRWIIAGCGCLALAACVVVFGALWYIDANYLWCDVFPFLPTCP